MKLMTGLALGLLSMALCTPIAQADEPANAGAKAPQLNGWSLNGVKLNGWSLNGVKLNGWSLNGFTLNGFTLNGLTLNGLTLNGLTLNGKFLNGPGLVLQGARLNGTSFSPAQQSPLSAIALDKIRVSLPKR